MILKFFLTFGRLEPSDSYKLYSYKKESVYVFAAKVFKGELRAKTFFQKTLSKSQYNLEAKITKKNNVLTYWHVYVNSIIRKGKT